MVWDGNFKTYEVEEDLNFLYLCECCKEIMAAPLFYSRSWEDFDNPIPSFEFKANLTEEQVKQIEEKYESKGRKDYIVGFGLINECDNCGSKAYFLKGVGDTENRVQKKLEGFVVDYNEELDEITTRKCNEPKREGFRFVKTLRHDTCKERVNAHWMKWVMGDAFKDVSVDDILNNNMSKVDFSKLKKD